GDAHLTVDMREIDKHARERTAAAIRRHVNAVLNRRALHKVVPRQSHADSLVQLADYLAGVAHWYEQQKRDAETYRRLLHQAEGRSTREQLREAIRNPRSSPRGLHFPVLSWCLSRHATVKPLFGSGR